jgi:ParB family chromosome partitioning protein
MPINFQGVKTGRSDISTFPPEELDSIILALNLRQDLGDLSELKKSIAEHGQLQPAVVRKDAQGKPVLVAGYRRLEAIREINQDPSAWGLKGPMHFLAIFSRVTEEEAILVNLRENLDRRDLSPIDRAFAARALERLGWEPAKIANAMRCDTSRVSQLLGLLELPQPVITLVHEGTATEALAQQLRGLKSDVISTVAERISAGEKPSEVLKEVKESKRATGKKVARTLSELKAALRDHGSTSAADLLAWIEGDPTVKLEEIFG